MVLARCRDRLKFFLVLSIAAPSRQGGFLSSAVTKRQVLSPDDGVVILLVNRD